jgi:NAD dependent epimerase/dehydratase family enzyme
MGEELLLASQRVLPARLRESGYRFQHTELESTLRELLHRR